MDLFSYERQKSHKAGPFNSLSKLPLMLGAGSGVLGIYDLSLTGNKPAIHLDVFIVDILEVLRAEETLFFDDGFVEHGTFLISNLERKIFRFDIRDIFDLYHRHFVEVVIMGRR